MSEIISSLNTANTGAWKFLQSHFYVGRRPRISLWVPETCATLLVWWKWRFYFGSQ